MKRFWDKVQKIDNGCWLWTASTNTNGYGHIRIYRHLCPAHRLSWEFVNGEIPAGMHVLHTCDTPACVNPSHLWLGTHRDNHRDKAKKGRSGVRLGVRHPKHKLTEDQVLKIYSSKETTTALAAKYGITMQSISYIRTGKNWSWLTRPSHASAAAKRRIELDRDRSQLKRAEDRKIELSK